jgi:hypothetical protein
MDRETTAGSRGLPATTETRGDNPAIDASTTPHDRVEKQAM